MAKQIQALTFAFAQYLDERHWQWSDAEKKVHLKDAPTMLKHICFRIHEGLKAAGETGKDLEFEFAGITHDKDMAKIRDVDTGVNILEPIDEHLHGVISLSKKRDLKVVAGWIGVEPQFVEPPKKGRFGKENLLAYLIHAKQPEKYQYDPKDVLTFGTFDYMAYWASKANAWERQSASVQKKENTVSAHWLTKQVQAGRLSKRDIMNHPEYRAIYADNMPMINDAIMFYGEMKGFETLEALERGEFQLSVMFITGASGSGKTHFALNLIREFEKQRGWRSYQASAGNPMDGYNGEEVLLLDDLRATSLSATEWLQMLDARTTASMSARYRNKQKAFRTLVITSYMEPYQFFNQVRGAGGSNEALDQFIRRIMLNVRVHRVMETGRYVEIEAIGRTALPVIYDTATNKFIASDGSEITYEDGLGRHHSGHIYSQEQLMHAKNSADKALLSFAGYPVYTGEADEANKFIANVIANKNDPERDHTNTDRPPFGSQITFFNENPEMIKALDLDEPKLNTK